MWLENMCSGVRRGCWEREEWGQRSWTLLLEKPAAHQGGTHSEDSSPKKCAQPPPVATWSWPLGLSGGPNETEQGSRRPPADGVTQVRQSPRAPSSGTSRPGLRPHSLTWARATPILTPLVSETGWQCPPCKAGQVSGGGNTQGLALSRHPPQGGCLLPSSGRSWQRVTPFLVPDWLP